ncbi:MAG: hypothetical protein A2176_13895 [Spirochaetes bacterium RBG_13_51_14]|nr:MAG: hypothetical protein A2176_13895 [Spirochaetes bacterium RBG_13_51_14]
MLFISGYDTIAETHRGTRHITYTGVQSTTGRQVIIKYFPFDKLTSSHIVQLTYEYEQAKHIDSNNVARVYIFEKIRDQNWNGLMFFIENPTGITLREYSLQKKIQPREFLDIAIQIARGLKEIHQNEIIHSDINPGSIIVNPETRNVKIRDFGFNSITAYKTEDIYNPEVIVNNLPYISPEQTGRINRSIDYRSDFYSLGITLYELLTGEPPFPSSDPLEIIHSHMARLPQPPTAVKEDIPQMISTIIMKMMAKNPENRYQSAHGIISDLEECMRQLKATGRIELFTPGKSDIQDKFIIPQKLYGRTREIDALISLFDQTRQGPIRVLLVSGYAGIGKTTLIHELYKPVTRHKGYFVSGKFNSLDSYIPYSAIMQAFQALIKQILSENGERVKAWKQGLMSAVGPNGRIITDILPETESLIGSQPEIPETGPEESQNRFRLVLKNFIKLFAAEEHPLVMVLEDLQWADSASLALLKTMVADPDLSHILFIGSYRSDAITDPHPLTAWLADIREQNTELHDLQLGPLTPSAVNELIADTLKSDTGACRELAELIYHKTGGNPFFLRQFLKRLHDDGILIYSSVAGWHWDMNRIQRMRATENVIVLMSERISRMREESREILTIISILGARVTPEILSEICGRSLEEIIISLNDAVQNELIITTPFGYALSHDRIHESIISITSVDDLKKLHYRIGNTLMKHASLEDLPEKVFSIIDHFNQCLDLISDPDEKWAIVQINILAAIKAKSSTAYLSAVKYFDHAISLLPDDVWEENYPMAFSIFMEKAECHYLAGTMTNDTTPLYVLLKRARTVIDRAKIYSLLIVLYSHQNRVDEAIELGLKAMGIFKLKLPKSPSVAYMAKELYCTRIALRKKTTDYLYNLPLLEDRAILQMMDIMMKITVPAYYSNKESDLRLIILLALKIINMTLKHGNSRYAPYAYAVYGAVVGTRLQEYTDAYEFGRLGLALNDKFHDSEFKARLHHIFGALIACWKRPYHEYIEHFATALRAGMASGDFLFTSYAITNILSHSIRKGRDISSLILIYETHLNFINLSRFTVAQDVFNIFYSMIQRLKGLAQDDPGSDIDEHDASPMIQRIRKNRYVLCLLQLTRIMSAYIFGDYEKALQMASRIHHEADNFLNASIHISEYYLYFSLSIAGSYHRLTPGDRKRYLPVLKNSVRRFKTWSDHCPENFIHLYHLLQAELLRVTGNGLSALRSYGQAIHFARKNGYINHEAMIFERAADFHIQLGNETSAMAHIRQAHTCYREWGADAKVRDIENKFAPYLNVTAMTEATAATRHLNYTSIVNSLQAISSEIITEDLLKKLMKIALENAGGDRGFFITMENNSAAIVAETTLIDEVKTTVRTTPLSEKKDLLVPVINYVIHSKKCLVINDARREDSLPLGQYPPENRPLSVLCLPVVRHSALTGILYLENRFVAGAFTIDHIEILELLASQAAISLEIAQLYDKLTQEITQHWRAEAALRESEDRYRLVVESMNEGICVLDDKGLIQFVNNRFCEMIGYERDEVIGRNLEHFLNETNIMILKQQLMRRRRGEHEPYEIEIMKRDGGTIATIVSPRPIYDHDGNFSGSFGLFTDITEKKRMEEDLQKASKIESLGVFAGGIAHDFNNLLTAIIGNISLARLSIPLDDDTSDILHEAEAASLRAKDLTHQLLTFSRGGAPIKKTTSIKHLLRQTIDFALSGSNIVCIYTIQNDLQNAEIDEGQITQVIHNLIINAMQAMKEGGVIEVKAVNEVVDEHSRLPLKQGHYIRIEFSDHGIGIPPENQRYIFDPYFTTKENGSGLGLTVSYSIIKRHEGHISFESEPGRGTTFIIYLPSSKDQVRVEETEEQKSLLASGRVLIMDDDEVVLRVAGNMLSHLGMTADFATHGEEAIELYRKSIQAGRPYDIIIMDLTVPGKMGGKETIAKLKEINPAVKAIVSSGYSNDPVMANYSSYGFIDVVAKPYRVEDLKAVINRVLYSF